MMSWNIAGLALLAVFATTSVAADPVSTEARIRALEANVNAAYAANDLPAYFTYYADDLRALFPEGPTT